MNRNRNLVPLLGSLVALALVGCMPHYAADERPMTEAEARAYEAQVHEIGETSRQAIQRTGDVMVEHERAKAARYRAQAYQPGYQPQPAYQPQPQRGYYEQQPAYQPQPQRGRYEPQPGYQPQPQPADSNTWDYGCPTCRVTLRAQPGTRGQCPRCGTWVGFPTRGVAYVLGN
ncbi:MAG: hypothetical protein AB7N76_12550 [Planctomycetota bacterium]